MGALTKGDRVLLRGGVEVEGRRLELSGLLVMRLGRGPGVCWRRGTRYEGTSLISSGAGGGAEGRGAIG